MVESVILTLFGKKCKHNTAKMLQDFLDAQDPERLNDMLERIMKIAAEDELLLSHLWLYWIQEESVYKFCKDMISDKMSDQLLKTTINDYLESTDKVNKTAFNAICDMLWKKQLKVETMRVVLDAVTDNTTTEPPLSLEERI